MSNPQLIDYIRNEWQRGVSKEDISNALVVAGWSIGDVDEVFQTETNHSLLPSPPQLTGVMPNPAPQPASKKFKFPDRLRIALLIFILVGSVIVDFLPRIAATFGSGRTPEIFQLAFTAIFLIAATAVFLWYAEKTIGLGRGWFLLAFAYNSLIIIIKFILSPYSLYQQVILESSGGFNPNAGGYILVGILVLLLYVGAYAIIHAVYRKRLHTALQSVDPQSLQSRPPKTISSHGHKVGLIIGILLLGFTTRILFIPLLLAPLLITMSTTSYLVYVFFTLTGLVLLIAIIITLLLAIETFERTTYTAIQMRDGAVLATFHEFRDKR